MVNDELKKVFIHRSSFIIHHFAKSIVAALIGCFYVEVDFGSGEYIKPTLTKGVLFWLRLR
jgi:hypothetical protein